MPRIYKPWIDKHKAPRGFGSWCPELPDGRAQEMLTAAVPDPTSNHSPPALYYSDGESVFTANGNQAGEYHGYPIAGAEAPPPALRALRDANVISRAQFLRLLKQTAVPGT
jgi:hypothetical protein